MNHNERKTNMDSDYFEETLCEDIVVIQICTMNDWEAGITEKLCLTPGEKSLKLAFFYFLFTFLIQSELKAIKQTNLLEITGGIKFLARFATKPLHFLLLRATPIESTWEEVQFTNQSNLPIKFLQNRAKRWSPTQTVVCQHEAITLKRVDNLSSGAAVWPGFNILGSYTCKLANMAGHCLVHHLRTSKNKKKKTEQVLKVKQHTEL